MERGVRDMAIDVVKLYEEVQKENRGTGVTAEVTKHVICLLYTSVVEWR